MRERAYHVSVASLLYNQTADAARLDYARTVLLRPEAGKDVRLFGLGPFFPQPLPRHLWPHRGRD